MHAFRFHLLQTHFTQEPSELWLLQLSIPTDESESVGSCSYFGTGVGQRIGVLWHEGDSIALKKVSGLYLETDPNHVFNISEPFVGDRVRTYARTAGDQLKLVLENPAELKPERYTPVSSDTPRRGLDCSCSDKQGKRATWGDTIQNEWTSMAPPNLIYHYSSDSACGDDD